MKTANKLLIFISTIILLFVASALFTNKSTELVSTQNYSIDIGSDWERNESISAETSSEYYERANKQTIQVEQRKVLGSPIEDLADFLFVNIYGEHAKSNMEIVENSMYESISYRTLDNIEVYFVRYEEEALFVTGALFDSEDFQSIVDSIQYQ